MRWRGIFELFMINRLENYKNIFKNPSVSIEQNIKIRKYSNRSLCVGEQNVKSASNIFERHFLKNEDIRNCRFLNMVIHIFGCLENNWSFFVFKFQTGHPKMYYYHIRINGTIGVYCSFGRCWEIFIKGWWCRGPVSVAFIYFTTHSDAQ